MPWVGVGVRVSADPSSANPMFFPSSVREEPFVTGKVRRIVAQTYRRDFLMSRSIGAIGPLRARGRHTKHHRSLSLSFPGSFPSLLSETRREATPRTPSHTGVLPHFFVKLSQAVSSTNCCCSLGRTPWCLRRDKGPQGNYRQCRHPYYEQRLPVNLNRTLAFLHGIYNC